MLGSVKATRYAGDASHRSRRTALTLPPRGAVGNLAGTRKRPFKPNQETIK